MGRPSLWVPPSAPFVRSDVRVGQDVLDRAVRSGVIVRLFRGVYLPADQVPSDALRRHLVLAAGYQRLHPDLVASHETAALAHDLPLLDTYAAAEGPPRFTAPPAAGRRSSQHPRVRLGQLPRHQVEFGGDDVFDLLLTSPARTAVDLAADGSFAEGLMAVDAAARRVAIGLDVDLRPPDGRLDARVREACLEPLRDAARVRTRRLARDRVEAALVAADPRRESPLESIGGGYLHRADIPPPTPQVLIVTEEGDFYGDLGWPEFGLIIEFDGLGKYQTAQDVRAEKFREQSLRRAGWRVERFLWHDVVDDPAGFVEVVRRLLREQGWRG